MTASWGSRVIARKIARSSDPPSTTIIGMSRSVRVVRPAPAAAPMSRMLSRNDETIVGTVRASVMMPDASTAPAPM